MHTIHDFRVKILSEENTLSLEETLRKNRNITEENFFSPDFSHLHDPFLLPDMKQAVRRILEARERHERVIVFGDYDVDGVSGTALLVRYLTEIGCEASYRLPHRVHDGYGLKEYFFDELHEKGVKLVVTVDCGTRDILPIRHAKSLGIDVIVTDHHAVPEEVPTEVVAIVNPKRQESEYPFRDLAGAGVALKLVHALTMTLDPDSEKIQKTLREYIDFASLGTVSDCMPIIGENRVIVSLGLEQMHHSRSHGLRKFLSGRDRIRPQDADIIGFQIGPRINAAGRMDTPMTALGWLLAGDARSDELFAELEYLNENRKGITENYFQTALQNIDLREPILIYDSHDLEHGVIGLVAGKLAEMYGKPAIVIKNGDHHPLVNRKGYDIKVGDSETLQNLPFEKRESENAGNSGQDGESHTPTFSVASCRSPEWCNIIELLDSCRDLFVRYGGHRQASGFTIETEKIPLLRERLHHAFCARHDEHDLPKRTLKVECVLDLKRDGTLANLDMIDRFRPFGIGNEKPLFLLQNETILACDPLGKEGKHLQIRLASNPDLRLVAWGWGDPKKGVDYSDYLRIGNVVSLIVELERNEWNGRESVGVVVRDIVDEGGIEAGQEIE